MSFEDLVEGILGGLDEDGEMDPLDDPGLTIPRFFDAAVARNPEKTFVQEGLQTLTYKEFQDLTFRAAGYFQGAGIGHGDRVCLFLGNSIPHMAAWFGLNRLGAISVPINPRLAPPEIERLLRFLAPACVLAEQDHMDVPLGLGLNVADAAAIGDSDALRIDSMTSPGDAATFISTSGSTGEPKAVMQTHRTHVLTGQAFPHWVGLSGSDRVFVVLPLHHINAQAYSVMGAVGAGATLVLCGRFSASQFWEQTRDWNATEFNTVGGMLRILGKQPHKASDGDNPVRLCYTALAMPQAEHLALEDRFNMKILVGYGLSESTFGTVWPAEGSRPYGTIGYLRQHPALGEINEARVVTENGEEAEGNQVGELLLRNPATMLGYYKAPGETAKVLRRGWLRTGDLVSRDETGLFTFVGRAKDVIRVRGENVAPAEIENVMLEHPDVLEVAVIGVESALGEQEVKAFVVLRDDAGLSSEGLGQWCAQRLAFFKVPSQIVFRAELPKTETARVARSALSREL